ncbi:hypothetical protein C8R44DRAFT_845075 [Mycena epipterygia]|nr:hypothetical protein C8R44DRAFT_845075 [Mycena epipterygia]
MNDAPSPPPRCFHCHVRHIPSPNFLVLVSLIPNNNIRYTMLGVGVSLTVFYGIHFQRPSVCLRHLESSVGHTEKIIHEAKSFLPEGPPQPHGRRSQSVESADPCPSSAVPYCRYATYTGLRSQENPSRSADRCAG